MTGRSRALRTVAMFFSSPRWRWQVAAGASPFPRDHRRGRRASGSKLQRWRWPVAMLVWGLPGRRVRWRLPALVARGQVPLEEKSHKYAYLLRFRSIRYAPISRVASRSSFLCGTRRLGVAQPGEGCCLARTRLWSCAFCPPPSTRCGPDCSALDNASGEGRGNARWESGSVF